MVYSLHEVEFLQTYIHNYIKTYLLCTCIQNRMHFIFIREGVSPLLFHATVSFCSLYFCFLLFSSIPFLLYKVQCWKYFQSLSLSLSERPFFIISLAFFITFLSSCRYIFSYLPSNPSMNFSFQIEMFALLKVFDFKGKVYR